MRYHNPRPIERPEAVAALASPKSQVVTDALVRLALHDADWPWVQARCLEALNNPDLAIRRTAATCLGHLARIHRQLDLVVVLPALRRLQVDPEAAGTAEDALEDVLTFVRNSPAS